MDYLQYTMLVIELLRFMSVLNLVINGLPSILKGIVFEYGGNISFKPCYKWITFNTTEQQMVQQATSKVLNLVINGLPSILWTCNIVYNF